jgi:hypothetical protein
MLRYGLGWASLTALDALGETLRANFGLDLRGMMYAG